MSENLNEELKRSLINSQRDELTEHFIYSRLAESTKDEMNRGVLKKLSEDELEHYRAWQKVTHTEPKRKSFKMWSYLLIARLFGPTFALRLMERGEDSAHEFYETVGEQVPEALRIAREEEEHEQQLLEMINEERLKYVGSMVLGLNDALVELTGALAGFTFALQDARLIDMTGLITGIAASLSMGASEYLSTKSEGGDRSARKASMYTTLAYLMAVVVLVLPFVLISHILVSLGISIIGAILILFVFTFYISVAKDLEFRRRFIETASISLGVAALSFIIGLLVRAAFGIEV